MGEKKGATFERKQQVIGALIGLVKACESHDPLQTTTPLIIEGLLVTGKTDVYGNDQLQQLLERIHEEKFTIVPGCRTCASPCGNTSDFDMRELAARSASKQEANQRLLMRLHKAAARMPLDADMERAFFLYQGLAAISLDWEPEDLDKLDS